MIEIFTTRADYECEQTILVQPKKMCAEHGKYVRYADYERLEARVRELEANEKRLGYLETWGSMVCAFIEKQKNPDNYSQATNLQNDYLELLNPPEPTGEK